MKFTINNWIKYILRRWKKYFGTCECTLLSGRKMHAEKLCKSSSEGKSYPALKRPTVSTFQTAVGKLHVLTTTCVADALSFCMTRV
jgi:hypothetical protein